MRGSQGVAALVRFNSSSNINSMENQLEMLRLQALLLRLTVHLTLSQIYSCQAQGAA